jgi:hypothetical protein
LVSGSGNPKSNALLVGEYPGQEEQNKGYAAVGKMGSVLNQELITAGIDHTHRYITNLFQHTVDGVDKSLIKHPCVGRFTVELLKEMEGRTGVLLMGSLLSTIFIGQPVTEWSGLIIPREMTPLIPKSVGFVMVIPNPAFVFHGSHGEVRRVIQKFAKTIKDWSQ